MSVLVAPYPLQRILFWLLIRPSSPHYPPATVEYEINDGDELPIAGGIKVLHAPGHSSRQVVFLWLQHGGVLFAADTCSNLPNLAYSLGYEDLDEGKRRLAKLAKLDFEVACFGHGNTIVKGASGQFRKKWSVL